MRKVDEINAELREAERQADAARVRIRTLEEELKSALLASLGIVAGATVVTSNGKHYKVHSIDRLHSYSGDKPWLNGFMLRKDGTFSAHTTRLYGNWSL